MSELLKNNEPERIFTRRQILLWATATLALAACGRDEVPPTPTLVPSPTPVPTETPIPATPEVSDMELIYDFGDINKQILQNEVLPAIGLDGELTDEEKWFGLENLQLFKTQKNSSQHVLRVRYPAGSASQTVTKNEGAPVGGVQFNVALPSKWDNKERLNLGYSVRFPENFAFVKGGKLPGFYAGEVYSGQRPPDGTNGFSTRYMWNREGRGSAYIYSPEIEGHSFDHGIHYGLGNWSFVKGEWQDMRQQVRLNEPGEDDGRIQIWMNGKEVLHQQGMRYRGVENLEFGGVFFSTFFGGSDSTWATPIDTHIDFANFHVDDRFRE